MAGEDIDAVLRIVAGETPDLAFLPHLPDRGVGADPVGQDVGLLVDIPAEVVPSGWRICSRPGRDVRRADDLLRRDADSAAEHLHGVPAVLIQVLGPLSLAARLELRSGSAVLSDQGALADLQSSLAEGLVRRLAQLGEFLPGTRMVVQLEEPDLGRVIRGAVPTPSGFGTIPALSAASAVERLGQFAGMLPAPTLLSGTQPGPLWEPLHRNGFIGFVANATVLAGPSSVLDVIGESASGGALLVLSVPSARLAEPDGWGAAGASIVAGWRAIGLDLGTLAGSVVPAAGFTAGPVGPGDGVEGGGAIGAALAGARRIGTALIDPPHTWLAGTNT